MDSEREWERERRARSHMNEFSSRREKEKGLASRKLCRPGMLNLKL